MISVDLWVRTDRGASRIVQDVKRRLLYLIGELRAGGSEHQLYYLVKSLDRERYEPEVAVWSFQEDHLYVSKLRALNVKLHTFPSELSRIAKLKAFRRLVVALRPDIVHSYSFYTNFAAQFASLGTKTIPIGGVRSDLQIAMDDSGPLLGLLSARWPRTQIFNSVQVVEQRRLRGGLFAANAFPMVRNGIDLQLFRKAPGFQRKRDRAEILGVGSLFAVKRWDRVIAAAARLKASGVSFRVRIAGGGPLKTDLEVKAAALGVADCVLFLGHCNDIPGLLADSDFLVHASENEACPNVVMEAMACGRAVVATDVGDVRELVRNGATGFVVPAADDRIFADRLAALIADRELAERMGSAGREYAERNFGLDRLVSETLEVYRKAGWTDSRTSAA